MTKYHLTYLSITLLTGAVHAMMGMNKQMSRGAESRIPHEICQGNTPLLPMMTVRLYPTELGILVTACLVAPLTAQMISCKVRRFIRFAQIWALLDTKPTQCPVTVVYWKKCLAARSVANVRLVSTKWPCAPGHRRMHNSVSSVDRY